MLTDKSVLLTGGAGSVARALIPQILAEDPQVLRVFDNSESGLAGLKAEVSDERCRYLAGDVRDEKRLARAMEDIDIVIHTAGMKHVDVCEYNPFEAVKTNVLGLQNVVDTAINAEVERVVFTSSDKAVNPANTMGTTKLLGEKLITAGNKHKGRENLRLTSVRFGNIVDSSHSVVPLFTEQIRSGGPVQLTDERMTRFFLTYNDVFDLITQALEETQGGEVFVYKMPAISIKDLAEAMVDVLAPSFGYDPANIGIELIGRRTGETYHEEIMTARETECAYENDDLYAIRPEASEYLSYDEPQGLESTDDIVRSSKDATKLSKSEIVSLLESNDALVNTNE